MTLAYYYFVQWESEDLQFGTCMSFIERCSLNLQYNLADFSTMTHLVEKSYYVLCRLKEESQHIQGWQHLSPSGGKSVAIYKVNSHIAWIICIADVFRRRDSLSL